MDKHIKEFLLKKQSLREQEERANVEAEEVPSNQEGNATAQQASSSRGQGKKKEGISLVVDKVMRVMDRSTHLIKACPTPERAVIDARILSACNQLLQQCVENIDVHLTLSSVEAQEKLQQFMDASLSQLASLDQIMDGLMPRETPTRAGSQGTPVMPTNVQEEQGDVLKKSLGVVMDVLREMIVCNDNKPVCYFKLVINPESFVASCDNMYYVSCLIKNGQVQVALDDNGLPVISPTMMESAGDSEGQYNYWMERIKSITVENWKEIVEVYNVTHSRIPCRESLPKK